MRVAEGVDLQCRDVTRQQGEVLRGRGEHVPGIEIHKGHEEVEADGRCGGDDEVGEGVVADCFGGIVVLELVDDNVDRGEGCVGHDETVADHTPKEHLFSALRTVAHGQDELHADEQRASVAEDVEDDLADAVAEGIHLWVSERTGDEVEGEVEIGKREEREHELHELVEELNVEEYLAPDGVVGRPDLLKVEQ